MIALYVHALAATGVVRNVRLLAAHLKAKGHDVALLTALPGGACPPGILHRPLLRDTSGSRALQKLRTIGRLRQALQDLKPAILISAGNHDHLVVWTACRGLSLPRRIYRISNDIVRATPGARAGGIRSWNRRIMARLAAADAAHMALVSPTLRDTPAFRPVIAAGRATVIANGIDVEDARRRAEAPPPHPWMRESVPLILAVGRLAPQKNFGTLLDAFARLRARVPARLIILGDSRDATRATLIAQAAALGIVDDVDLPGVVPDIFPWLAYADAFVLPSWWEGSANVLLEAMAVDLPVVASRSAGNAIELLDGGRCGFLVDPANPQAIADALERQLDPVTAIRPGIQIERFDLNAVYAAWDRVIAQVGDERP